MASRLGLSYGIYQQIPREDLKTQRMSAKFVLLLLTDKQYQRQCMAAKRMGVVRHPPYSLYLAPCDFLFLSES